MATYTYPGVYIEETTSGQHTITGVATSIAAFIGWANKGPVDAATLVQSWAEYQSMFGGMIPGVYLGYAVYQFFLNGGSQAYIVRLVHTDATTAHNTIGGLTLYASSPGGWANTISVAITNVTASKFNLQVLDASVTPPRTLEAYTNLTVGATDPMFAVSVINADSSYITFTAPGGSAPTSLSSLPTTASATSLDGGSASGSTGHDGTTLAPNTSDFQTALNGTSGYSVLNGVPIFNLLCVPGENSDSSIPDMQHFCATHRAFLIVDAAQTATVNTGANSLNSKGPSDSTGATLTGTYASNSGFYFPWVIAPDPQVGFRPSLFPPCGFVAGVFAATDANRGVWKAPAGINATLNGALGLQYTLSDADSGLLNPQGINCLRQFRTFGNVVWGARTIAGSDVLGSQWKYIPIRRLALYIESSLYEGTQWAVFEPNDEQLWGQVRLSIGTFMQGLFLQGAFAGTSAQQAYFVKCDGENNPESSTVMGILNVTVGFAPVNPAEFVVIHITQILNT